MNPADITPLLELGPEGLEQDDGTRLTLKGLDGHLLSILMKDYLDEEETAMILSRAEALRLAAAITDYFTEPSQKG